MTPDRDPDRRRPAPPHPGFVQKPLDLDLDICRLCKAVVLATDLARIRHVEWDQKISQLLQLSGSGRVAPGTPPDPDPTVGAGSRDPSATTANTTGRASPAPAQDAPTPPPGQHRGGVEGANQGKRPAGNIPPADGALPSVLPEAGPPASGRTKRSRPDQRGSGKEPSVPGRELTVDEADQRAYDAWLAAGGRS